ncbi:bifunctional enzyme NodQ [Thermoclostridium stercorarium subsp. stercorarium DSM 8532]|uniref:sulfate adenylyltransferase n=1 Tax=Thermoclostridium stercorarium (strain ATCC 35414 / DSM 8532 / NCIMB 11754) TaxID=1121335 RepID=L7VNV7_THES1|nr:GTP-binding protein [Thermoclostridium stercorarium]AGC67208.1 bifunctional enzyme NodQ [Thermoclostridium stercorarium subsp. stercorarium DSM 8532]AGI38284.1 sulfate adenylyltransferase large subunit [Thermoclostridium stercorarium subsp. stercorarium DSM 8532]
MENGEPIFNRRDLINKQDMNIVIVGHVDHGKSTVIGRLLADTNSLPEGKLEQVKEICRRNSKPFEYAFLLDALKDEQAQGITIDTARCFFQTEKRNYIIIDAPGHIEFLKNMITGAARAEAALLVIDASEGIQENSRRHGFMLSMLGIKQVCVLVNKMDLVGYGEKPFRRIERQYRRFLKKVDVEPVCFIPISAREGDNVANHSDKMSWYKGMNVLEVLDSFKSEELPEDKPFRMPVQDVYKFTRGGDNRRIIAGTIETGKISVGDEVIFYPSGKRTRIKSIEGFNRPPVTEIGAGWATGFTVTEQIYVKRGELMCKADELKPKVTGRMLVNLFWLGKNPLVKGKDYYLKLGTAKVSMRVEEIRNVIDASSLVSKKKEQVDRNEVAECILSLDRHIAFDLTADIANTSRFVIVDEYEISGGGIVISDLEDQTSWVRDKVLMRNYKWIGSEISAETRALKYGHGAALILITGEKQSPRKELGRALEKQLFDDGKLVYYLGMGSVMYGVDADLMDHELIVPSRQEHIRRLTEVAHIMLDAGMIFIISARELTAEDYNVICTGIPHEKITVIWVGEEKTTDIPVTIHISSIENIDECVRMIRKRINL